MDLEFTTDSNEGSVDHSMSTRRIKHLSMNIEGLLRNRGRKSLAGFILDDDGKEMNDRQARAFLAECIAKGWRILPMADCEGFDPKGKGCPGHSPAQPI